MKLQGMKAYSRSIGIASYWVLRTAACVKANFAQDSHQDDTVVVSSLRNNILARSSVSRDGVHVL